MNFEITDIVIILVSFAACGYCFVLNRRLKALQNTKDGLGATIVAMTKSISTMSASTQETRLQVGDMVTRLSKMLDDAHASCARMEALKLELAKSGKESISQAMATQTELNMMMRIVLDQSKLQASEMKKLMQQARDLIGDKPVDRSARSTQDNPRAHVRVKAGVGL